MKFKRYIANCSGDYTIYLTLSNKKKLKLQFNGRDVLSKERYVDVEDVMVQQALEASPSFGIYFALATYAVEEQTAPSETSEKHMEFPNAQTAREWLNTNLGISLGKLTNKAQVTEQYHALGFTIKYLTD